MKKTTKKFSLKELIKISDISDGKGKAYMAEFTAFDQSNTVFGQDFDELKKGIEFALELIQEEFIHAHRK